MLAAAAALALAPVAYADTFRQQVSAADAAAARASVIHRSDIGQPWKGGFLPAGIGTDVICANFRPRFSDLVVTGAAASRYTATGSTLTSITQVMQSEQMMTTLWRRFTGARGFISCARRTAARTLPAPTHFVSLRELKIPPIGRRSRAWRMVYDVDLGQGETMRMVSDTFITERGRSQVTLMSTMPVAWRSVLFPKEILIARVLTSRIRL
jgi:hypothetical protein